MSEVKVERDHAGVAVGGEIKAIYSIISQSRADLPDGAVLIESNTACGRVISLLKQGDDVVVYEVDVSKPNSHESERSYRGEEGSDACKVFNSHAEGFAKLEAAHKLQESN
jgi:hypothetical protein